MVFGSIASRPAKASSNRESNSESKSGKASDSGGVREEAVSVVISKAEGVGASISLVSVVSVLTSSIVAPGVSTDCSEMESVNSARGRGARFD